MKIFVNQPLWIRIAAAAGMLLPTTMAARDTKSPREVLLTDQGWRFYSGNIPMPVIRGRDNSCNNNRTGMAAVWLDKKLFGKKETSEGGRCSRRQ